MRSCCCFSRQQRAEWAKIHAVASAPAEGDSQTHWTRPRDDRSTDLEREESDCPACCASKDEAPADSESGCCSAPSSGDGRSTRLVLGIQARGCKGESGGWFSGAVSLPPPQIVHWTEESIPIFLLASPSLTPIERVDAPPTPPPRPHFSHEYQD
jgi:hypothetical protein